MSNDVDPFLLSSDDDNTIKDLLSKFQAQTPVVPAPVVVQQQQPRPHPPLSQPPPPQQKSSSSAADAYQQRLYAQQQFQQPPSAATDDGYGGGGVSDRNEFVTDKNEFEESYIDRFIRIYSTDVQMLVAFFVVSIVCCFLPIRRMVSQYIMSIESIPYSDTLIRSVVLSVLCYVSVLVIGR